MLDWIYFEFNSELELGLGLESWVIFVFLFASHHITCVACPILRTNIYARLHSHFRFTIFFHKSVIVISIPTSPPLYILFKNLTVLLFCFDKYIQGDERRRKQVGTGEREPFDSVYYSTLIQKHLKKVHTYKSTYSPKSIILCIRNLINLSEERIQQFIPHSSFISLPQIQIK